MIDEKDFILREVQRLTILIRMLISKVTSSGAANLNTEADEIDQVLKTEFDLSLRKITEKSDEDLLDIVKDLNKIHLENLVELLFELNKKNQESNDSFDINTTELINKNIFLINFLDENSKTFSIPRMNMKNTLQHWL